MEKYRIVLWDLDGTLLNFKLSERYALGVCLKAHGVEMTEEMLAAYSGINEAYWKRLEKGEVTKQELLPGRFREFFRKAGITHIRPEEMQKKYEVELGRKTFYVDASLELVKRLRKQGVRQYIVTNGVIVTQQIKMKNSGFDRLVDGVFISDEIGYEKPRKEFFEIAFGRILDFEKKEALLVGDSLSSDMRGADNAGVDACWYNPEGKKNEEGVPVKYEIRNLQEVYALCLNQKSRS